MPATVMIRMERVPFAPSPSQLHAAASGLFEGPGVDHHGSVKDYAVRPPSLVDGLTVWPLTWLGRRDLPEGWGTSSVRFGACERPVRAVECMRWLPSELYPVRPVRRADVATVSPLFFSHNGRDLPLPDPSRITRSLIERWNSCAPDLSVGVADGQALMNTVFLDDMRGGVRRTAVSAERRQVGFVGTFRLRLPRAAPEAVGWLFGLLMRFAALAGVGAQTTHGFGAVDVALDGDRLPARPAGDRSPEDRSRGMAHGGSPAAARRSSAPAG